MEKLIIINNNIMKLKRLLLLLVLILLFFCILPKQERFTNYISLYDDKNFYMRFLDYIHGSHRIPNYKRKSLLVTDLRGNPHLIDNRSDPLIVNPTNQNFKGFYWGMPHNRKVIRI